MHLNAFTIIIITPETLLSISFFRVWTLSSQSCLAYYYPYKTHKRQKTILYIKKNYFWGKVNIMLLYPIQSLENMVIGAPIFKVIYIFSALTVAYDTYKCVCCIFPAASFLYSAFPAPNSHISTKHIGKILSWF